MKVCMLEIKSWRTRVLINTIFIYDFVDPGGQKIFQKKGEAERINGN